MWYPQASLHESWMQRQVASADFAMPAPTLRILLVDDHEIVRMGLRALLQRQPGWAVCGEARDGKQAVEKAGELHPDLIIMDVTMPELNGLESARRIRSMLPGAKILMLSMHDSEEMLREALEAGAHGYVLKLDASSELPAAVKAIFKDRRFISPKIARTHRGHTSTPEDSLFSAPTGLTRREREVLQLLAEGKTSKEVAALLSRSVKTVDTHRTNIMQKLDLHSITDLTRYAIRNRIVQP